MAVFTMQHNIISVYTADSQEYKSFPMSSKLRAVMTCAQEKHPEWRLNTFALRLAAQETRYYSRPGDLEKNLYIS